MNDMLLPGLSYSRSLEIGDQRPVAGHSPDRNLPPAFATGLLVAFIEWTCMEALQPHLDPEQQTVGGVIFLKRLAPQRPCATITVQVKLVDIHDQTLRFQVSCHDEAGLIASGFHERILIETSRFPANLKAGRVLDAA